MGVTPNGPMLSLGPLNFLLCVNDLQDSLTTGTECGIFANDTQILRSIQTNDDIRKLQNDINSLHKWSNDWGLKFNKTKCMVLSVKRTQLADILDQPQYNMNNVQLISTTNMKDLGIIIDN